MSSTGPSPGPLVNRQTEPGTETPPIRVLFVCTGNICRSPTAEGVFRALVENQGLGERIAVDSAGTGAWHVGEPPDVRAQAAARCRGIDLSAQRARRVSAEDFTTFDYVVALDRSHFQTLSRLAPPAFHNRLHLFLHHAPEVGQEDVPDPYYGGTHGFEHVLDMIEAASRGLLAHICQQHPMPSS